MTICEILSNLILKTIRTTLSLSQDHVIYMFTYIHSTYQHILSLYCRNTDQTNHYLQKYLSNQPMVSKWEFIVHFNYMIKVKLKWTLFEVREMADVVSALPWKLERRSWFCPGIVEGDRAIDAIFVSPDQIINVTETRGRRIWTYLGKFWTGLLTLSPIYFTLINK